MFAFLWFITCAAIIFFAGKKLSYYGDLISEMTGLWRAWIWLILMASVTSLPELMVWLSSSAIVESADLATGDILGSCLFNLAILAAMDAFLPKNKPLLSHASQSHILAAGFGMILIALVGIGIYLPSDISILWVGSVTLSCAIIYLISVRVLYHYSQSHPHDESVIDTQDNQLPLKKVIQYFCGFATIIVTAALFLPHFAEQIAHMTGLGQSFVGTIFIAISTSLPEVAVSYAAIRMGSIDLSVWNLLWSNIFNIFILFLDDIFYTKGTILTHASDANLVTIFGTIIMTAIILIGLTFHAKKKRYFLGYDTIALFWTYFATITILYFIT